METGCPWHLIRVQKNKRTSFFQIWQVQNHLHNSMLLNSKTTVKAIKTDSDSPLLICSTAIGPQHAFLSPPDAITCRCSLSFCRSMFTQVQDGRWLNPTLTNNADFFLDLSMTSSFPPTNIFSSRFIWMLPPNSNPPVGYQCWCLPHRIPTKNFIYMNFLFHIHSTCLPHLMPTLISFW